MFVPHSSSHVARWRYMCLYPTMYLLLSSFFLVACSGSSPGGPIAPAATAMLSQLPLTRLHWCKKPFILFRDEHAPITTTPAATTTPTNAATASATATATAASTLTGSPTPSTLNDWSQIKPLLGFTVYLPSALPSASCLVSASGTVNDPVFGGSFIIGYTLPDKSPISFSEVPSRPNGGNFQCTSIKSGTTAIPAVPVAATSTAQAGPSRLSILLCIGIKGTTNIVFSGRGDETSLKQTFDSLQPDVAWIPAS